MADFGVGLASLAIQATKDLIKYIGSAKDAKHRIPQILQGTEKFADLLEQLDNVIKSGTQSHCSDAGIASIVACAEALREIEKVLGAGKPVSGSKFRQHVRSLGQSLSYPFKQEEILFLKDMLASAERHLHTALFAISLEDQKSLKHHIAQHLRLTQESQQVLIDQQRIFHRESVQQVDHQSGLIRLTAQNSNQRMALMQTEFGEVSGYLQPMAADLSTVPAAVPDMLSKLTLIEEKLNNFTLQAAASQGTEKDQSELAEIGLSMKKIKRRASKKEIIKQRCTCRGRSSTVVYLQWPFSFTKTQSSVHEPSCAYVAIEEAVTSLQLRFTMCCISLRRKAHLGFALSHGAGSSSVSPMLKCDRVVLPNSPGFRLLSAFKRLLGPDPSVDAWEQPANKLLKLFELRRASPHDRLPNGMTLLHYFCFEMPKLFMNDAEAETYVPNYYGMGKRILEYLPTQAMEKDDHGKTCIDYFVSGTHFGLVDHFLEYGIPVSLWKQGSKINTLWADAGFQINPWQEDALDCSDAMKVVLLKSEPGLVNLIKKGKPVEDFHRNSYSLYEMATRAGWRRGCEILLEHGVEIKRPNISGMGLLRCSVVTRALSHEDVTRFWLEARQDLDKAALQHVGSIEDEFVRVSSYMAAEKPGSVELLFRTLVQERKDLLSLATKHSINVRTDRLPDAQAWSVIHELEIHGVRVKPFLRPTRRSIYHVPFSGWRVEVLDQLYDAGFRDISIDDFAHEERHSISPLLYLLSCAKGPETPKILAEIAQWFVSKDEELSTRWSASDATALHCLGYRLGNVVYDFDFASQWSTEDFIPYFSDMTSDNCRCACSTSGCHFVTSFCKGLTTPKNMTTDWDLDTLDDQWRSVRRSWRDRLDILATFVGKATPRRTNRWLLTEFFRLSVFTALGIRHTCCDITRIQHCGDPDLTASPFPRYADDELRAVQEEDAELVQILEELVKKFGGRYGRSSCDAETFYMWHFDDEMDGVLRRLEEEDRQRYAEGRRQLGVVMGVESEDESTEESEEDEDDEIYDSEDF